MPLSPALQASKQREHDAKVARRDAWLSANRAQVIAWIPQYGVDRAWKLIQAETPDVPRNYFTRWWQAQPEHPKATKDKQRQGGSHAKPQSNASNGKRMRDGTMCMGGWDDRHVVLHAVADYHAHHCRCLHLQDFTAGELGEIEKTLQQRMRQPGKEARRWGYFNLRPERGVIE
jgi:hypothetical protein